MGLIAVDFVVATGRFVCGRGVGFEACKGGDGRAAGTAAPAVVGSTASLLALGRFFPDVVGGAETTAERLVSES